MREFKVLYALALVTVIIASLSACVGARADKAAALVTVPDHRTFSGSYLAGRFAQRQQDWDVAQSYMGTVLSYDGGNREMTERTFLLALGAGNFSGAKELAQKVLAAKPGSELPLIFMAGEAISRDDFKTALGYLDQLPSEGFGQYTKPMLTAWSLIGAGKKEAALKLLAETASPDDPAYRMHAGLMEELAGNNAAAAAHYKVAMANGLNLHSAVMIAGFFERTGQPEISREIYNGLDKIYPFNPFLTALSHRAAGSLPAPNIARAADGAAVALFDLATLLYEKRAFESAQIYGSLVQQLAPASPFARLMMGDIYGLHDQFDKAAESYAAIEPSSPIYWIARVRMTDAYEVSGQLDKAAAMLTGLQQNPATRMPALVALGDFYRRHNRFEDAVNAYNQSLAGMAKPTQEQWTIVYARGMAEERLDHWDNAEKDLLQALSFQPDNPMILNYIAYSWANKGVNLNKALEYAKHAAALKPDDGYILDSYGWILFRLSQYKEAAKYLEQAVAQVPGDSTLLDHLGDAYWQTGRRNEARYQWRHAHDLSQDAAFKATVQQKLLHGISVPNQSAGL